MKHELLMERTGFSKNTITKAVNELEAKNFIQLSTSRRKRGEFGSNVYTLCNPATGEPLRSQGGKNFLFSNDVRYIKIPKCVVREQDAEWSIANMSCSELRMYVSICWLANKKNQGEFDVTMAELKRLGRFSTSKTAETAREGLLDKSLLSALGDRMLLHDPYTGEPLHVEDGDPYADPANYRIVKQGRETRWNLNGDPEQVEQLLRRCNLEPIEQNDGELAILCPFHPDSKPSCFVSPKKRCFYCHGCGAKGHLSRLIMQASGVDKGNALKLMAEVAGQVVEVHEPDKNAIKYDYNDAKGKLIKQVLRYPDKRFSQRRPGRSGGWIWDVDGLPSTLYNLQLLEYASVVCVCEGEKDCDTITGLKLHTASGGDVFSTTSGNSESWRDSLADDLTGKRVVLMPDADEAGERYRAEVEASLRTRGIEFRVVGFGDVGVKDVSEFVANGGTKQDLADRIGKDWVRATEPSTFDRDEDELAQII